MEHKGVVLCAAVLLCGLVSCTSDGGVRQAPRHCPDMHEPLSWWRSFEFPNREDEIRVVERTRTSITWEVPRGLDAVRTVVLTRVRGSNLWNNTGLACQ